MANTRELSQLASVISVADETRNVGIGTTNPISKLHVVGDITATSFSGDGSALTGVVGSGSGLIIKSNGSSVGTAGTIDFGTNLSVSFSSGTATITATGSGGSSQFVTASVGIHTLSNVGIGTTNPTSKLTVSGDVKVIGVVTATTFIGSLTGTATTAILATSAQGLTGTPNLNVGIVTATSFSGDGSALTGVVGSGSGSIQIGENAPVSPSAGDLWYNSGVGRIFIYYDDGNSDQWVDAAPFNVNGTTGSIQIRESAPTSPHVGDLWYNSGVGRIFIYYADDDSDQWVDAAPFNNSGGDGSVIISSLAPEGSVEGSLWFSTINARLFIYYNDGDSSQWIDAAPFNSAVASIFNFPTGDYGDLTASNIDAFNQNTGDISYDCLSYPSASLAVYDLGTI